MRLLQSGQYRVMPWRNGAGSSLELYRADNADGELNWRVSIASVSADGPFSAFPGYDRHIMVIEGAGMALDGGPDGPLVVAPAFRPVSFSGDWPITARLAAGPVQDFNLIARRAAFMSALEVIELDRSHSLGGDDAHWFIHVLSGLATANGHSLAASCSLFAAPGETIGIQPRDGSCRVAACRLAEK